LDVTFTELVDNPTTVHGATVLEPSTMSSEMVCVTVVVAEQSVAELRATETWQLTSG
jgi:hypothetical protein